MLKKVLWKVLLMALVFPTWACAHTGGYGNMVDVRIVSDGGGEFAQYRTYPQVRQAGKYFYVEAARGERYAIRVTNRAERRIGLVIAVDGRNIISGQKSDLKPHERMYIIGPYETHTFEGWRTAMDRTNRFYFTTQSNSYAEKVFADGSAMGTIAMSVYPEKMPEIRHPYKNSLNFKDAPAGAAPPRAAAESESADRMKSRKSEQAGTGFGETTYSPSHTVHFNPEYVPAEKIVMKYEWRSELCRKGITNCGPKNRMWPEDRGFAPVPRDFGG